MLNLHKEPLIKRCFLLLVLSAPGLLCAEPKHALSESLSGYEFQSGEIQALQDDDFANPGMLWRDKGEDLFNQPMGDQQRACVSCHNAQLRPLDGVATRYPQYDQTTNQLMNIEQRINRCRVNHQRASQLHYESEDLVALTTYVAGLSSGMPFNVSIDGPARSFFEKGRDYFYTRIGQLNLSCKHCHEDNYGKKLRGDTLSQGHSNNYPAYDLDWQMTGSLHRRLRFCNKGVRAQPFEFGAPEYVNLELFLAWRTQGLPLEIPSVRR